MTHSPEIVNGPADVRLTNVSKSYPQFSSRATSPAPSEVQVLVDISLQISPGERVAILGRSGTGKSQMLRLLAGLGEPSSGSVQVAGVNAVEARKSRWIGFIPSQPVLFPWRSTLDNILLASEISKRPFVMKSATNLIERLGLNGLDRAYPHQLSSGQRSRVGIARALWLQPRLILADEVGANLDEITRESIVREIVQLGRDFGATLVLITHSVEEALRVAQVVYVLSGPAGRLVRFDASSNGNSLELQIRDCLRSQTA